MWLTAHYGGLEKEGLIKYQHIVCTKTSRGVYTLINKVQHIVSYEKVNSVQKVKAIVITTGLHRVRKADQEIHFTPQ